ncbi:MAG: HlyD family efflux transporter periplasmic adaptor subunit [Pirellulales bacterium]
MATLADSLVSSSARKLPVRVRPDLSARKHRYQGRSYWVVKDPVGLNYFRFQEEEFAILQMLDGATSLDDLKEQFEQDFPPQKITVEELGQFVGMLHRSGLVITDAPGQGKQLKKRRDERKRKELLSALANILAVRFKGIDPDKLLDRLHPFVAWLFTPWAVAACATLAASAGLLVAVQFDVFRAKLPAFHEFFAAENWFYLAIVLGLTKVIHEFGHGLSCKHFGGECHEMGVMVLVLTPCLYCNVSDSWMLPNKWHRAMIGAAGMYIEVVMASICTFVWWFSAPGMLNQLALSTMFVCSVSTIVFNANPLLRYDGYYILSDIMEIPNLRQKASTILQRKLAWWCLGLEEPDDPFLPQRNQAFFALYTAASAAYRWVVTFSILWFLYNIFKPYRLEVIGQMIGIAAIVGLVVQPAYKVGKFFYAPGRMRKVKRGRMYASLAVLAAAVAAVLFVPLPYHVVCPMEVEARGAESIYVDQPGVLQRLHARPGQEVKAGDVLAELTSPELDLEIADLTGKLHQQQARLSVLQHQKFTTQVAHLQVGETKEMIHLYEDQLAQAKEKQAKLTIKANRDGLVIAAPAKPDQALPQKLRSWSGSALEERNLGAALDRGVLLCQVGDPKQLDAKLYIDQDYIDFIRSGQAVAVMLDELPGRKYDTKVVNKSPQPVPSVPKQVADSTGGGLPTQTSEQGEERPLSPTFAVRAPLDDNDGLMRVGLRGRGKVYTEWQTLGQRGWRYLTRTFNFRL